MCQGSQPDGNYLKIPIGIDWRNLIPFLPLLEACHRHAFVAVEPDSGDYFLGNTLSEAIQAARKAYPDRISFALRVGHPSAVNLGVMSA